MASGVNNVKLLDFLPSMFGMRVKIALDLKGVPYDRQEEDFSKKSPDKSQELLNSNPVYEKIPVLIHDGRPICESNIIVEYIDEVWNDKYKLLPDDPYDRAVAKFWADFGDKKIYEAGSRILGTKGVDQSKAAEDLKEAVTTLDNALAKNSGKDPFFGGDSMNYADVGLAPYICWLGVYEIVSNGVFRVASAHELPNFHRWMEAVNKVPAVQKNVPEKEKLVKHGFFIQKLRMGEI